MDRNQAQRGKIKKKKKEKRKKKWDCKKKTSTIHTFSPLSFFPPSFWFFLPTAC
jgi:hypothetical protein